MTNQENFYDSRRFTGNEVNSNVKKEELVHMTGVKPFANPMPMIFALSDLK